jgi:hypothetical protein
MPCSSARRQCISRTRPSRARGGLSAALRDDGRVHGSDGRVGGSAGVPGAPWLDDLRRVRRGDGALCTSARGTQGAHASRTGRPRATAVDYSPSTPAGWRKARYRSSPRATLRSSGSRS